jgi:hypothetical protein
MGKFTLLYEGVLAWAVGRGHVIYREIFKVIEIKVIYLGESYNLFCSKRSILWRGCLG